MAETSQRALADTGDFLEAPFPLVFAAFCRQGKSGMLDVRDKSPYEGGKIVKRVVIGNGTHFAVQGGTVYETLLEILLARGKVNKDFYQALKIEFAGDYGKIEQKILSGAVVPPGELSELITVQLTMKLKNLFSLIRGHYDFKPQPFEVINSKHVLMPLEIDKFMLDAVREHYPMPRIKKEFAGIEKKDFHLGPNAKDRLNRFGFDAALMRWLRGIPDPFNWTAIVKGAPVKEDQAFPLLLALYFNEVIALPAEEEDFPLGRAYLDTKEVKPGKEVKTTAKTPEKKPADEAKAAEPAAAAPKAETKPPEEPPLPIEEMFDKNLSDKETLKEIDRLLDIANKKGSTCFELLGVKQDTSPEKIKKIYFKFAKKFHPDAKPDLFKGPVRDKVEDLFAKFTEAKETASNPNLREQYLKKLKSQVSDKDMEMGQRAMEAEMEFEKANIFIKKGQWQQAQEKLERAVTLYPDEPEYKMHLAWVNYKIKGPSETANAKRIIKEVVDKRPEAVDGLYFLGMIEKNDGELDKAEQYLGKVLAKRPHDIDVKRELQLLGRKKAAAPSKKKGGLFGKK